MTASSIGQEKPKRSISDTIARVSPDTVQLNNIIEQQKAILKALKPK